MKPTERDYALATLIADRIKIFGIYDDGAVAAITAEDRKAEREGIVQFTLNAIRPYSTMNDTLITENARLRNALECLTNIIDSVRRDYAGQLYNIDRGDWEAVVTISHDAREALKGTAE